MTVQVLAVFIDGVARYFQYTSDKDVKIEPTYLINNARPAISGCAVMVGVSGPIKVAYIL